MALFRSRQTIRDTMVLGTTGRLHVIEEMLLMPRMKILNNAEQILFDQPPWLSSIERRRVFDLPTTVWAAADEIRSMPGKIGSLISAAHAEQFNSLEGRCPKTLRE